MIKVLIVDDNPTKLENIKNVIIDNHDIPDNLIYTSSCTKDANKILRKEMFDLMVLDLVLPKEEGGECHPENGVNFLKKIQLSSNIKPPIHIVGLSGFKDKVLEFSSEFKDKLWNLIEYSEDSINWQNKLDAIIFHLVKTRKEFISLSMKERFNTLNSELESNNKPFVHLGSDWFSISESICKIIERSLEIPEKFSNGSKAKNINKGKLIIENEYDFQNLIHIVLRSWLPSTEAENIAIIYDGNTKYADFSINGNAIIIEVKHINSTGKKNDTIKTLDGLKTFYKKNGNVKSVIFLLLVDENVKIDKHKIEQEYSFIYDEPIVMVKIYKNKINK